MPGQVFQEIAFILYPKLDGYFFHMATCCTLAAGRVTACLRCRHVANNIKVASTTSSVLCIVTTNTTTMTTTITTAVVMQL